ncbi:hypothetical protein LTR96_011571 [Exophiala xenobiotica]|nr:hypothetical protein LTR96_011571 [Exophiala xenobiotica]KAK5332461.1 hypothetical protein LTR98_011410 [Exophiala xenobiotica]KAK5432384.1 hypothetical protein LTR18_011111 [Exophiala xenobiotica]
MAYDQDPSGSRPVQGFGQPAALDPDISMKAALDEVDAKSETNTFNVCFSDVTSRNGSHSPLAIILPTADPTTLQVVLDSIIWDEPLSAPDPYVSPQDLLALCRAVESSFMDRFMYRLLQALVHKFSLWTRDSPTEVVIPAAVWNLGPDSRLEGTMVYLVQNHLRAYTTALFRYWFSQELIEKDPLSLPPIRALLTIFSEDVVMDTLQHHPLFSEHRGVAGCDPDPPPSFISPPTDDRMTVDLAFAGRYWHFTTSECREEILRSLVKAAISFFDLLSCRPSQAAEGHDAAELPRLPRYHLMTDIRVRVFLRNHRDAALSRSFPDTDSALSTIVTDNEVRDTILAAASASTLHHLFHSLAMFMDCHFYSVRRGDDRELEDRVTDHIHGLESYFLELSEAGILEEWIQRAVWSRRGRS